MKALDLDNWNRKAHYEFFRTFDEPFFGLMFQMDLTKAYATCKEKGWSIFLFYLYQSIRAANSIPEFRYRIRGKEVVIFDYIHPSCTIMRPDNTFTFASFMLVDSFPLFEQMAKETMEETAKTEGLALDPDAPIDVIHYSALPWIPFTGLSHARSYGSDDSVPKITFGKFIREEERILLPLSIHVHHGLMDGYHVGLFYEKFQELLDQ